MQARGNSSGWGYEANIGCSGLLLAFGAIMIAGMAISMAKSGINASDFVAGIFLGLLPLVYGALWLLRTQRARQQVHWNAIERQVLVVAQRHGCVVTAMQVAAETDLSFDDAKRYLDRLADHGDIEVVPTDMGLAYRFPGAEYQSPPQSPFRKAEPPREPPSQRA